MEKNCHKAKPLNPEPRSKRLEAHQNAATSGEPKKSFRLFAFFGALNGVLGVALTSLSLPRRSSGISCGKTTCPSNLRETCKEGNLLGGVVDQPRERKTPYGKKIP